MTAPQHTRGDTEQAWFHVEMGRPRADTVIAQLFGEIDATTEPALTAALDDALNYWPRRIIIGLSHVDFFSGRAASLLREAQQRAAKRGASFALTDPTPIIKQVLSITGVDRSVPVHGHMFDALSAE